MSCVGILDIEFEPDGPQRDVLTRVELKDQHNEVFYDKLTFLYLQMPNFTKGETEVVTYFDKWLYFLKNLATLEDLPAILREEHFEHGFHLAETANFSPGERLSYQRSLMVYWDVKNVIDTAREEGREAGRKQAREESREQGREQGRELERTLIRQQLLARGIDPSVIEGILGRKASD